MIRSAYAKSSEAIEMLVNVGRVIATYNLPCYSVKNAETKKCQDGDVELRSAVEINF